MSQNSSMSSNLQDVVKTRQDPRGKNGQDRARQNGSSESMAGISTNKPLTRPLTEAKEKRTKEQNKRAHARRRKKRQLKKAMELAATGADGVVPTQSFPSFNKLSIELQRRVFETAYFQDSRCGAKLSLVSRKVREWIEPFVYQTVVLHEPAPFDDVKDQSRLFLRTFKTGSKPMTFYSQYVKSIYTNTDRGCSAEWSDFELDFLSVCTNIESLECWSETSERLESFFQTVHFPRLKTLCININLLPKDNTFSYPIFQHITHLDIGSPFGHELPCWKGLQSLQNVTHMRVQTLGADDSYEDAMDEVIEIASEAKRYFPPGLQYFVILMDVDFLWEAIIIEDPERWERFEDIRLGRFDNRILLGCHDASGGDMAYEIEEDDQEKINRYEELVAVLPRPTEPRFGLAERFTWEEVARIATKRTRKTS